MQKNILENNNFFFIGIGGIGMSAIAQYLKGIGKNVSGSDRIFHENENHIKKQLANEGINCFSQDCSGLNSEIEVVVVSTAIENTVPEYKKALELGIKIVHRAEMLKAISETRKTIAIAGTSGKSTTVAMLFQILELDGFSPSLISGAGLISIQKLGKIGNAHVGTGEWLIIEADESDGTLTKYSPEIGVILNIDKDHKEFEELEEIFGNFAKRVKDKLIVNQSNTRAAKYSEYPSDRSKRSYGLNLSNPSDRSKRSDGLKEQNFDFNADNGFQGKNFSQLGLKINFSVKNIDFEINTAGKHNMENALAAISVANYLGISLEKCSETLKTYEGIYRRMQKIGEKKGIIVIDDYAHNPAKISAAISACKLISDKVIAWFQPHGFAPTRFLKNEFIEEISKVLRNDDEIWMSEIYYAGGTVSKDISAKDLITGISNLGKKAFFVENRNNLPDKLNSHLSQGNILLLMGARDNSLENFAKYVFENI
jgi:UDP-N-acetylmuramate--alanine ligase